MFTKFSYYVGTLPGADILFSRWLTCMCKILKQAVCRYLLTLGGQMLASRPIGGQVPAHRPLGVRCGHLWNWVVFTSHCACMHQIFWEVPETHKNILDHLEGVDTPAGRVPMFKNQAKLSKYIGVGEINISASIRAPCTKFLEVPETHGNISRLLGRCSHTHGQRASAQKVGQVEPIHVGVGRSISQLLLGPHVPNFFGSYWDTYKYLYAIWEVLTHLQAECQHPKPGQIDQINVGGGGHYLSFY